MRTTALGRTLILALLAFVPATADGAGPERETVTSDDYRLPPVVRVDPSSERTTSALVAMLDNASPRSPARLWRVFQSRVRTVGHEEVFFSHSAFVELAESRQEFFRLMARDAPRRYLQMANRLDAPTQHESFSKSIGDLESRLIRYVSQLTLREQLALYLGEQSNPAELSSRARNVLSLDGRVDRILDDPSLAELDQILDTWFDGLAVQHLRTGLLYVNKREFVQCKVMIVRNLSFSGEPPNESNVRGEYARILELRQTYRDLELFSGRNVVYAASGQRIRKGGQYVFGQNSTRRYIERQGASVSFFRDRADSVEESRQHLRSELERAQRLTFLFEGHGRPGTIQFAGGLSVKELARLFEAQYEVGRNEKSPVQIFIPVTCRGHDLSRAVLLMLHSADPSTPKPVIIAPEEFGQYFVKEVFTDPFLVRDLQLGTSKTTTLDVVMDHSELGTSVYVPDGNNVPAQIL